MRAGPRPRLDAGLLSALREAITTCRLVEFRYLAQSTGLESSQRVRPLGLLYGNRAFLVASSDWNEEPHLWRLANVSEFRITDETFDRDPDFNLERYAKRSFGTFQEEARRGRPPGLTPPRPGTPRPSSSTRTSPSRATTTDPSPSASRPAASTRCAGTSSPGGTASPSKNLSAFAGASLR